MVEKVAYDITKDDLIAEAIKEAFGERCLDYAAYCPCCEAWKQYDMLSAAEAERDKALERVKRLEEALREIATHARRVDLSENGALNDLVPPYAINRARAALSGTDEEAK